MTIAQERLIKRIQDLRRTKNPQAEDLRGIYVRLFGENPPESQSSGNCHRFSS